MDIINERPGDEAAVRAVTRAAFLGQPHSQQTEAAIVDALREADVLTVSLVAVEDGVVVGHVAFSPSRSMAWIAVGSDWVRCPSRLPDNGRASGRCS